MSEFDPQSHTVPHHLEDPIPILFWQPLEFTLAISLMGFGSIMNLWIVGMVAGTAVLIWSRYLKRGAKRGAMQHLLWSYGIPLDKPIAKRFKPSWVNDFIE